MHRPARGEGTPRGQARRSGAPPVPRWRDSLDGCCPIPFWGRRLARYGSESGSLSPVPDTGCQPKSEPISNCGAEQAGNRAPAVDLATRGPARHAGPPVNASLAANIRPHWSDCPSAPRLPFVARSRLESSAVHPPHAFCPLRCRHLRRNSRSAPWCTSRAQSSPGPNASRICAPSTV